MWIFREQVLSEINRCLNTSLEKGFIIGFLLEGDESDSDDRFRIEVADTEKSSTVVTDLYQGTGF